MITIDREQLVPLREVPRILPRRANGRHPHLSAIYRWVRKGIGGVVLESVRIGGVSYTSLEALQRFAERLTAPSTSRVPESRPKAGRDPAVTARRVADELGILSDEGPGVLRSRRGQTPC